MVRVQLPHQVPVRWAKKVDTIAIWGLLIWRLSGNPRNLVSSLGGCSFFKLFGEYLGIIWSLFRDCLETLEVDEIPPG